MKKLLTCLVLVLFCLLKANADPIVTVDLNDAPDPGPPNSNFTYCVTSDGYLYYSLLDGGSSDTVYYDSEMFIQNYAGGSPYVSIVQYGGGDITGSVYIGTTDCDIQIAEGSGQLNVDGGYTGWEAILHVAF